MSMKGKETMSKENEKIVMGKFGATYGIRGWLKVFSYTDEAESIFDQFPKDKFSNELRFSSRSILSLLIVSF